MDKGKIDQLKDLIKTSIEVGEASLKEYKESAKPVSPDNAIGRVSRMEAINDKSVLDAAIRKAEERLAGLRKALEHIDDEDFGDCAECGEEISWGRLKAVPWGEVCMSCIKSAQEEGA